MKEKVLNSVITGLAVLGTFIIIGAVGKMDYMVELGQEYPLINTIKTTVVGIVCVLPAIIRSVMY